VEAGVPRDQSLPQLGGDAQGHQGRKHRVQGQEEQRV